MTLDEAAHWMLQRYHANNRVLYQEDAASNLLHLQDAKLAYFDQSGNVCISRDVLAKFTKLTPEIVYEGSDKFWRERYSSDRPGRRQ